ncbi:hypothetical protein [Paenibacillus protaetiae]|uniref:Uncharacterized protein n=1 Tax=Paenibacillus protaetiae TaxID=2509456 RepID=A0A4P6EYU4_9BACL|nr:hypothetical protein [Paenibacillus protaetiae]QAY65857.1 hypothetical protein ET464_05140 [Paenibacillus protaetiae]
MTAVLLLIMLIVLIAEAAECRLLVKAKAFREMAFSAGLFSIGFVLLLLLQLHVPLPSPLLAIMRVIGPFGQMISNLLR